MDVTREATMSDTRIEQGCVVVAVDGSEEGFAAVEVATDEARRHRVALHIAHVMPACLSVGPLLMASDEGVSDYASETVASAARLACDVAPGIVISTHVLAGGRVSELIGLADGAGLIVVGRRPATALDRAWSGGTLDGIASRARCPVLVVPEIRRRAGAVPRVVLGFKSSAHAHELFEAGFRVAQERGAEIEVLHAWKLSGCYDDMIARRVGESSTNRDQKGAIRELLAPWLDAYPGVQVRIQVVHEYPVRALVEASGDADRLVLVKPPHGSAVHHLGRTARGTLRFGQCPVEVVPARRREDPVLSPVGAERAGRLLP
jgi:nucleotide-binding universal stress UspA family protein